MTASNPGLREIKMKKISCAYVDIFLAIEAHKQVPAITAPLGA